MFWEILLIQSHFTANVLYFIKKSTVRKCPISQKSENGNWQVGVKKRRIWPFWVDDFLPYKKYGRKIISNLICKNILLKIYAEQLTRKMLHTEKIFNDQSNNSFL